MERVRVFLQDSSCAGECRYTAMADKSVAPRFK